MDIFTSTINGMIKISTDLSLNQCRVDKIKDAIDKIFKITNTLDFKDALLRHKFKERCQNTNQMIYDNITKCDKDHFNLFNEFTLEKYIFDFLTVHNVVKILVHENYGHKLGYTHNEIATRHESIPYQLGYIFKNLSEKMECNNNDDYN